MRLLIADDEAISRRRLEATLLKEGYEVATVRDGDQAWDILQQQDAPQIAVLDWMMPGLDGIEICRRLRERAQTRLLYLILLTAKDRREDIVAGLRAGADDYVVKPFDPAELRARVQVGVRLVELQNRLTEQARELEAAHTRLIEQERFNAVVSAMADGILTTDDGWRLMSANHAGCLLLNLCEDDREGMPLEEALAPFSLSPTWREIQTARERTFAFEIARPDTEPPLFIDARLTRMRETSGAMAGAVLVLRDVTQERQAHHVQATFVNMVSHKLRTPLTLLSGYLDMARRLSPDQREEQWDDIAQVFEAELAQLDEMVRKLLDLKAAGEQLREVAAQPIEVRPVIDRVGEQVRQRYPDQPAEVEIRIAPDAGQVLISAGHLEFVLDRLLDNALKFGDKQVARVGIGIDRAGEDSLRFSVVDNGPGIPHEYYDRVLQPFVQIEDRVTGQVPGLGIGLFMVQQVVEAYGGSLSIESRLGEGATVSFTLPTPSPGPLFLGSIGGPD